MTVLDLQRIQAPFPLAVTDAAFEAPMVERLADLFERPQAWARHQDHFYRCFIAEVDGQLPADFLQDVRRRVAGVLELDLAGPVRVTAQRMERTDGSDRHTDRPLVGYEAARLVVQLDRAVGGHFRVFDDEQVLLDRAPQPNGAVAFELCSDSHHDVTACTDTRRTVVFHFWHAANPPDAREALDAKLGGMSFADLPPSMDDAMARAEAVMPEERTFEAAAIAWLMQIWGNDPLPSYQHAIEGELSPTEALAGWLVRLNLHDFDRSVWEAVPRPHGVRNRWLATGPRCPECDGVQLKARCRWCDEAATPE